VGDVVLTADEVAGLTTNLLVSKAPPTAPTRFTEWLREHADALGRGWANELDRHFR
jgi:NADH dehydrogenase